MPHITNFGSNNTENGWIYKNLEDKMAELDQMLAEVRNLLDAANTDTLDFANLVNDVSNKAPTTYVKRHIDDSVRHITDAERTRWNKYLDGLKLNLNLKGVFNDISELPVEGNEQGDAYHILNEDGNTNGYVYLWNGLEWAKLGDITGKNGKPGPAGPAGRKGDKGDRGESAYEIWKEQPDNKNKTIEEFLESMKGEQGPQGPQGKAGPKGDSGSFESENLATDIDITYMINKIWE